MLIRRLAFLLVGSFVLWLPAGASAAGCPNEAIREAQDSTFLGECRAYEMVSPVDKNGGDIITSPLRTRASADGNAAIFGSLTAFADAQGTTASIDYAAQRSADGWTTHAITPRQDPFAYPLPPTVHTLLQGETSEDLTTGVMYALRPLTAGAPNVAHVPNLYLRTDLLSGGAGAYQLLSNSVNPLEPYFSTFEANLSLSGASRDFHHIIFETKSDLTADASGEEWKLYEWEDGTVRLAGILPDGTPAPSSEAGRGGYKEGAPPEHRPSYTPNMISRDGSRVFFTDRTTGSTPYSGKIYVREDHARTIQLNVEERAVADPNGPQPAQLWVATPDGSQVFFTTAEQLTEDDTNNNVDLYRYDFDAPAGHHLTLLSRGLDGTAGGGVSDVLGVSEDGADVYFRGIKPLVAGEPELANIVDDPEEEEEEKEVWSHAVFVWHDGAVHYVGTNLTNNDGANNTGDLFQVFAGTTGSSVRVSATGVLAYTTDVPFTSYSTLGTPNASCNRNEGVGPQCDEIYIYDPATDRVSCASCDPSGASPTGDANFTTLADVGLVVGRGDNQHLARALTADGSKLFFDSPDALVPQDTNGLYDVYEYDVATGKVQLISSGQGSSDSLFDEATPDGRDVFFTTRQRLVTQDVDDNADLYVARVEGGIASQQQAPEVGCAGDACQASPAPAPSFGAPASATLAGIGNLPAVAPEPSTPAVKHKAKKKHKVKKGAPRKKPRGRGRAKRVGRSQSVSRRAGR